MSPHGVDRIWLFWCSGTQISGVRFWNFTAWQPASAATSTSWRARSTSPLWLMPISAMTYTGWPGPTRESPIRTGVATVVGRASVRVMSAASRGENSVGQVPHGSVAAGPGKHYAGKGPHLGVRVGDRYRPPDAAQRADVVDVVADVRHALGVETLTCHPVEEGLLLVVDAVQRWDPQLAGAGRDDGVGLGGQDEHPDAGPAQPCDTHAVGPADDDGLVPVLVDDGTVVGGHAVEVGDDRVDVDGPGQLRVDNGRQGAGELEVLE